MPQKWWVLTAVACGTFMATLDSSIVNIALPTLTKELATELSQIKWVVIVYLLVITSLLLPFGRLSDQAGRKRIFQLGFVVFTFGSAFCGIAPSLGWLIAARVLQGVGASMLMANGPAIITAAFLPNERGKALGTLAMVVSAGLVSGPSIGGFLITTLGWRAIFLVNIPIGFLGVALAQRYVPREKKRTAVIPFDWSGAFLQMIVLLLFMITVDPPRVIFSGSMPFSVPRSLLVVITMLFAAVFLKVESTAKAPVFDFMLLKDRTFWTANLASFLTFVSYSAVAVLMPFYLEEVMRFAPDRAGLFMSSIPLTVFVVAPISGRLSDRLGSRGLSVMGALVGAFGIFVMAGAFGQGIYPGMSGVSIVLALSLVGLSTGLFQSPNNNAIMNAVPEAKLGTASALLATVRNLGLVTGTGMATGLFTWRIRASADFVESLHFTFYVAGAVGIGAAIASFGKRPGAPNMQEELTDGMET